VQYTMTFPKPEKEQTYDISVLFKEVEMYAIISIIINNEYGFPFFNGIDFVGNEATTTDDILFLTLKHLTYLEKHGIKFIPHIGETNKAIKINKINKLLNNGIERIGHGLSLSIDESNMNLKKNFYVEFCPISNKIFGYFRVRDNPHRRQIGIDKNKIKLMICSDDNGIFGYSTVSKDYCAIVKAWKLSWDQVKELIINGIQGGIPKNYVDYYMHIFKEEWSKFEKEFLQT
jgi:adenosine deaminase